jgi:y4mF family transcriptional regulator
MRLACEARQLRKQARLTQEELADRAGVGLRFVRELERGKQTVRLDKVNKVLRLFSREVGAVKHERSEG